MSIVRSNVATILLICAALGGCASQRPTLYQWQGYQYHVETYLRGDELGIEAQTQLMESDLQKIRASGVAVPPGYYAHLGLLYGKQGNLDQFAQLIRAEKEAYPESATYMNFLLRNFKTMEGI